MKEENRLLNFESKLKYIFNDKSLLKMALHINHMHMSIQIQITMNIMKE